MVGALVVLAILIVAIPTCQMVGCTMGVRLWPVVTHGLSFTGPSSCGGSFVFSQGPSAVVPAGLQALLVTLLAALAIVAALRFSPLKAVSQVRVVRIEPPPPPEDPRGERIRI